jgi:flagellar motor component MotA
LTYAQWAAFVLVLLRCGSLIVTLPFFGSANLPPMIKAGLCMSLALLTTFYGLVFSNLIFQPLARKLTEHLRDDAVQHSLVMEAVLDIADAKNPLALSHRLNSYIRFGGEENGDSMAATRPRNLKPLLKRIAAKR